MFSFKKKSNHIIAAVEGGYHDGKLLYLHNDGNKDDADMFDRMELNDGGKFQIYPETRPNQTSHVLVAAPTGSGKSHFCSKWLETFYKVFPRAEDSYLFTNLPYDERDPAYKIVEDMIQHVQITDDIIEHPPHYLKLATIIDTNKDGYNIYNDKAVIFDDYAKNKAKVAEQINLLRDQIFADGRKQRLHSVVCSNDLPVRKGNFRDFFANINQIVLFPRVPVTNMRYVLENYFDITRDLIKDIRKNSISRWIVISRCGVPYVITENIALIYDADREFDRLKDKSCPSSFSVISGPLVKDSIDETAINTKLNASGRSDEHPKDDDHPDDEDDDDEQPRSKHSDSRIYKKGVRHVKFFKNG